MEQTIHDLGRLLRNAVPTICLLVVLYFYLKAMLFGPLERVLKQREELTAGARKAAEESLSAAERKAEEYETKFREARAVVYREQEETRRGWLEDQANQIAEAHERSRKAATAAKEQIAAEAVAARQTLVETSATLADQIATAVLSRRAG